MALYWEVVLTARRKSVAVIGEFANDSHTSNLRSGLIAMVIFASVVLNHIVKPYDGDDSRNTFPSYGGNTLRLIGAHDLANRWLAFSRYMILNRIESTSLVMSLSLFWTATSIGGQKSH